jgi:hypothetical protein
MFRTVSGGRIKGRKVSDMFQKSFRHASETFRTSSRHVSEVFRGWRIEGRESFRNVSGSFQGDGF